MEWIVEHSPKILASGAKVITTTYTNQSRGSIHTTLIPFSSRRLTDRSLSVVNGSWCYLVLHHTHTYRRYWQHSIWHSDWHNVRSFKLWQWTQFHPCVCVCVCTRACMRVRARVCVYFCVYVRVRTHNNFEMLASQHQGWLDKPVTKLRFERACACARTQTQTDTHTHTDTRMELSSLS